MFEKIISSTGNLIRFIILAAFVVGGFALLVYHAPDLLDKAILFWHKISR